MGKIDIKDLVKLILSCVSIMYVVVVFAYLFASIIVYIRIDIFDFDWKEAFSGAFRKGGTGGATLGFGIWIKAKLQEYKKNR